MLLLSAGNKGKQRKLDARKRTQLGVIFAERLIEVIENEEKLASLSVQLTKVRVISYYRFPNITYFFIIFDYCLDYHFSVFVIID